jgi:RNA polymerase sigma factor (sigma-70 family)
LSTKKRQRIDELHAKGNAQTLDFTAISPDGRSSMDGDTSWSEYRRWVLVVAKGLLHEPEIDADDVAQAVIEKAWRFRSRFRGESKFRTWLYTITIRTVWDFRRKLRSNTISLEDVSVDGMDRKGQVPEPRAPNIDVYKAISVEERLKKLPPKHAEIVRMWMRSESSESIGQQLGMSDVAVRQKISKSVRKLIKFERQENSVAIGRTGGMPPLSRGKHRRAVSS